MHSWFKFRLLQENSIYLPSLIYHCSLAKVILKVSEFYVYLMNRLDLLSRFHI